MLNKLIDGLIARWKLKGVKDKDLILVENKDKTYPAGVYVSKGILSDSDLFCYSGRFISGDKLRTNTISECRIDKDTKITSGIVNILKRLDSIGKENLSKDIFEFYHNTLTSNKIYLFK